MVLCPPIGYEHVCAYPTYRALAVALAERGMIAVRLDYDGTGDSAGTDTDPGRVAAWTGSVREVIDFAASLRAGPVSVVGMRLGALLGALALEEPATRVHVDSVVLWDPVTSGRQMLRHLRALQLLGVEGGTPGSQPSDDGTLDVAGTTYSSQTAAELQALTMPDMDESIPVLALFRPGATTRAPAHAEIATIEGQDALLDAPSSTARIPLSTVTRIAEWLDERSSAGPVGYRLPESPDSVSFDGIRETVRWLDDGALLCIVTEPAGPVETERTALLLVNNAADPHFGPGRAWVTWARDLARQGYRSARVDLSGIGDSPARDGQARDLCYSRAAVGDIRAAAAEIDRGEGVLCIGICSGGRNSLDAVPHPAIRGVVAINADLHVARTILEPMSTTNPLPPAVDKAHTSNRYWHHLATRTPGWIHEVAARAGRPPLWRTALRDAALTDTRIYFVYGADDFMLRKLSALVGRRLRPLRTQVSETWVLPELDHALMARAGRNQVLDRVEVALRTQLAGPRGGRANSQKDSPALAV